MKSAIDENEKAIPTTIGSLITVQRKKAGMTQQQVAQAAGVPRYWLGRWERYRALPNQAERNILSNVLLIDYKILQ